MKNLAAWISTLIMATILAAPLSARETGLAGTAPKRLAKGNVTALAAGPDATVLNINNLMLWVDRDGFFPWTHNYAASWAAEYPKGTAGLIFAEGVLWGAKVDDAGTRDNTKPRLRVNGATYATGLKAGKVLYDGSGKVTGADENPGDRHVWRVRRDYQTADLTEDAASFFTLSIDAVTSAEIQAVYDQYDYDWQNWPAAEGAPFEEVNGDGNYDPLVDIPGEPGAAQTIWLVANDLPYDDGREVAPNSYGSPATGMELQLTLWAYDFAPDNPLGNMLFKRARLIYTGLAGGPADAKLDTVYFT
ncbi:MAG: hypothetical protein IID13_09645, partial [Candidatus Marinimicrobia bacterium]|nr:hypothetical protein [Candidatus Neomarinimicrobiota bacterium]